jgi:hypothetical protein
MTSAVIQLLAEGTRRDNSWPDGREPPVRGSLSLPLGAQQCLSPGPFLADLP